MLVTGILKPGQETALRAEILFFLPQLPFDPQDCVMLTGFSSSIVCVPKSSPVEMLARVSLRPSLFPAGWRNGSLCCCWVVFQIRSRIKDFFLILSFPLNFFSVVKRNKLFLRLGESGLQLASISFITVFHSRP